MRDPYFRNVGLLLHLNGTDGSTTFTDSSSSNHTAVAEGTPTISTTQSVFGGSSLNVATGKQIKFADHADFNFGSGDFCVEGRAYITTLATQCVLFSKFKSGASVSSINVEVATSGQLRAAGKITEFGSEITFSSSSGAVVINTWFHFSLVRLGNVYTIYKDGVSVATQTLAGSIWSDDAYFIIGAKAADLQFTTGYIDEFRVTKGVARYIANFTTPTAEFSDSGPLLTENMSRPAIIKKSTNRPFHHIGK